MKTRTFRNLAFALLVTAFVFVGQAGAKATGEYDFWVSTFECSGGDYTSSGWSWVLCETNCNEIQYPNWYQYFNNQTWGACNEYCTWQSTGSYYCYLDTHQTLENGDEQCWTFCECFCEYR